MTKLINGIEFNFEKDKTYGTEFCIDYMFKEEENGCIVLETPREQKTIEFKIKNGWKKVVDENWKKGFVVVESRGKTTILLSEDFQLPVPVNFNDFIRIYSTPPSFKKIIIEGACYYDGQDPVSTWATIEREVI